jgi:hypothetical protein
MKSVPLSLTDNQLAVVLVGARSVPACRALMGGRPASDTAVAARRRATAIQVWL